MGRPGPPIPTDNQYLVRTAADLPDVLSQWVIYNCEYDPGSGIGLYFSSDGVTLSPVAPIGGVGAVTSVFGRTGVITALCSDYSACYGLKASPDTITGAWAFTGGVNVNTLPLTHGAFTLPLVDGAPGFSLTTNGAGVVTWQPTAATSVVVVGTVQGSTLYWDTGGVAWTENVDVKWSGTALELNNAIPVDWQDQGGSPQEMLILDETGVAGGTVEFLSAGPSTTQTAAGPVYEDLTGVVLTPTTVSDEYLVFASAFGVCSSNAAQDNAFRLTLDDVELTSSEQFWEGGGAGTVNGYQWQYMNWFTYVAGDLQVEFRENLASVGATVGNQGRVSYINLTDLGPSEHSKSRDTGSTGLSTTPAATAASVTVGNGSDDYLILVCARVDNPSAANLNLVISLFDGSVDLDLYRWEFEGTGEKICVMGSFLHSGLANTTYTVRGRTLVSGTATIDFATIVAIRLDAFAQHVTGFAAGPFTPPTGLDQTVVSGSFTVTAPTGNWIWFGGLNEAFPASGFSGGTQVGLDINSGGFNPVTWDDEASFLESNDATNDDQYKMLFPDGGVTLTLSDSVDFRMLHNPAPSSGTNVLNNMTVVGFSLGKVNTLAETFIVGDPVFKTVIDGSTVNPHDAYALPTADGTSGQLVSTDGGGVLSFIDPPVTGPTVDPGTVQGSHLYWDTSAVAWTENDQFLWDDTLKILTLATDLVTQPIFEVENLAGTGVVSIDFRTNFNPRINMSSPPGSAAEIFTLGQMHFHTTTGPHQLFVYSGPNNLSDYVSILADQINGRIITTVGDLQLFASNGSGDIVLRFDSDLQVGDSTGQSVIYIREGAADKTSISGSGQIWVDSADGLPYYTTDADVIHPLVGGPGGTLPASTVTGSFLVGTPTTWAEEIEIIWDDVGKTLEVPNIIGGTIAADILGIRGSSNADLGVIDLQSPMTIGFDYTVTPTVNIIHYNPTIPSSGAAVTAFMLIEPDITVDAGTFIPSTVRELGIYRQAVTPGFAVHTVFLGQPTLETTTATVQPNQNFMFAAQALYENVGAGAVATPVANIIGMTMLPRIGTRVSGDVLSVTNITGMSVSAAFATVAGTTVNLGTIRGIHMTNPAVGLFQPQAGVETMTAYYGMDVNAIPFGGTVPKAAVRSALVAATNTWFLQNIGTAHSTFNDSHLFEVGIIQHLGDGILFSDSYGAAGGDLISYWDGTGFLWNPLSGADHRWEFDVDGIIATSPTPSTTQFRVAHEQFAFGQSGIVGNQVGLFVANTRTAGVPGGWADFLLTQAGSLSLGAFGMSDVSAWVINSISFAASTATISELATLRIGGMTTSAPGATVTERAAIMSQGRFRQRGSVQYSPINPTVLATGNNNNWAGLLTGSPNNNTRHWARITSNADGTSIITGIDATAVQDGDTFKFTNVGAFNASFGNQDVASTAANRIISPTGATYIIGPDESCEVIYDTTTARWRILYGSGA